MEEKPMPARRGNRLPSSRYRGAKAQFHYVTLRVAQDLWITLEAMAARETISLNALANALFDVLGELDQTEAGRQRIHQACAQWRTRWERKFTTRRRRRAPAVSPAEAPEA
jgi:hypothetical protein